MDDKSVASADVSEPRDQLTDDSLEERHKVAMMVLYQIANRKRKTVEQRLAHSCVMFLETIPAVVPIAELELRRSLVAEVLESMEECPP